MLYLPLNRGWHDKRQTVSSTTHRHWISDIGHPVDTRWWLGDGLWMLDVSTSRCEGGVKITPSAIRQCILILELRIRLGIVFRQRRVVWDVGGTDSSFIFHPSSVIRDARLVETLYTRETLQQLIIVNSFISASRHYYYTIIRPNYSMAIYKR